jgi:DNA repair exonuclease SbcCD ATPase subunit
MTAVSGSTILRELDGGLASLRQDVHLLDSAIAESGHRMRELGEIKLGLYKKLAEQRLVQLERGDLVSGLDSVSHEIMDLLERREREHRKLLEEIENQESRLDTIEVQREQYREQVDNAALELDEAEADVQERLENDAEYAIQLERTHKADAIADEAERKMQDAMDDKEIKGKPFESDTLFMYLWKRQYGTSGYSANPVSRMLDGWVAKLCGYDKARPNYWMLNEIPVRLKAHAEAARARADREFEDLKALEAAMAESMGLPRLNEELDAREQALEACDESISTIEKKIAELGEERSRFASGKDRLMVQALERLAAEMKSDGIRALRKQAASTPGAEDDRIVEDIADVDRRLDDLEEEYRDRQKIYSRRDRKVRDLESLRHKFKRRGYDDMRSVFRNGSAVAAALQQFLGGLLDDDDLWRVIARSHRLRQVRSRPGFGSGGFPRHRGTWRLPRSGAGWKLPPIGTGGGLRFPSGGGSRRRGGGGFSTGGGF